MSLDDYFDEALCETARRFHSTPEAVLRNIQELFDEASASPDPAVQERWSRIPYSGGHPDARETLLLLATILQTPETCTELH
mgnify:FL=1